MMTAALAPVALLLLLTLVLGLVRIWRGPAPADRMLASQLFATTGVAMLLVLAEAQSMPALRDVALTLGVLAILACVAFVARVTTASDSAARDSRQRETDDGN